MTTIDNIMALALNYRLAGSASRDEREVELRTALTEALAAQPVRDPSCDTCKHCTVASQDSFEETCFVCSHYYDNKYEAKK